MASRRGALALLECGTLVQGCATIMTPFLQTSCCSLSSQFTIDNRPLMCPLFSIFRKKCIFSAFFGHNFSSQDANFQNFCSQDPSFFKENPLLRPYFWKPVQHPPTKEKVEKKKKLSSHPPPLLASMF